MRWCVPKLRRTAPCAPLPTRIAWFDRPSELIDCADPMYMPSSARNWRVPTVARTFQLPPTLVVLRIVDPVKPSAPPPAVIATPHVSYQGACTVIADGCV